MEVFYLENMNLRVTINLKGAEVSRVLSKEKGIEYMHAADSIFWNRTAPVLFPIVGSLKDKTLRAEGKEYTMSQHGFARDMDFKFVKQNNKSILFRLESNSFTKELYPYKFALEVSYLLEGYKLKCSWKVINTDTRDIHFQIGGHPAFMCPIDKKTKQSDYYIAFDTDKPLKYSLLKDGLVASEDNELITEDGMLRIDEHLFDRDALIFENQGVKRVELCKPDKMVYLSVSFDAPLFGIWSPAGKGAPFICIEPWYGRADKTDFNGTIAERDFDNSLAPGETFEASYDIEFL